MELKFCVRKLVEKYKEKKNKWFYIDLEKAYDKVFKDILWRVLKTRGF